MGIVVSLHFEHSRFFIHMRLNNVYNVFKKFTFVDLRFKVSTKNEKKMKKNFFKIISNYFKPTTPPSHPWVSSKISAQSILPFGRLYATFIYTNVLFYYIDFAIETFVSPPQKNGDTFFNVWQLISDMLWCCRVKEDSDIFFFIS